VVVQKPGYEEQAVKLVFSETGTKVVALKEWPAPAKPPRAAKKKRPRRRL